MKKKRLNQLLFFIILSSGFFGLGNFCLASDDYDDLAISEIMYDPEGTNTGHSDWIELHNNSAHDIAIKKTNFGIIDETKLVLGKDGIHYTTCHQIKNDFTMKPGEYVILADNDSDFKTDFPAVTAQVIDTTLDLSYLGDSIHLSSDKCATFFEEVTYESSWGANDNGMTLEKITLAGDNFASNWQESYVRSGTPGKESSKKPAPKIYPDKIYINDLLPNPSSDENKNEYIELFNNSAAEIDLEGWVLKDKTTSKYTFSKGQKIAPNSYLAIYSSDYPFALNNSGSEEVSLLNPDGKIISSVAYSETAKEDYSYSFDGEKWKWTSILTPGKENEFLDFSGNIKITALSPNPKGVDSKNEWIQIKNGTKKEINLKGWSIATGWKKMYNHPIRKDFKIKPGKSKKLTRKICAFTLNNAKDKIELRDPLGKTVQTIKYNRKKEKILDDEVYQIKGKKWNWDKSASPVSAKNTTATETTAPASPPSAVIPAPAISEEELKANEEERQIEENSGKSTPKENSDDDETKTDEEFSKMKVPKNLALNNSLPKFSKPEGRVLGAYDIRETNTQYFFTPPIEQKHWARNLIDNFWQEINFGINKVLLRFF